MPWAQHLVSVNLVIILKEDFTWRVAEKERLKVWPHIQHIISCVFSFADPTQLKMQRNTIKLTLRKNWTLVDIVFSWCGVLSANKPTEQNSED